MKSTVAVVVIALNGIGLAEARQAKPTVPQMIERLHATLERDGSFNAMGRWKDNPPIETTVKTTVPRLDTKGIAWLLAVKVHGPYDQSTVTCDVEWTNVKSLQVMKVPNVDNGFFLTLSTKKTVRENLALLSVSGKFHKGGGDVDELKLEFPNRLTANRAREQMTELLTALKVSLTK